MKPSRTGIALVLALAFTSYVAEICASGGMPPLRSAAAIEALPGTDASLGRPFDIHAVVGSPAYANLSSTSVVIVHDETGGTILQNHVTESNIVIRAGDRIHATGRIDVEKGGIFADCHSLEIESHGTPLPPIETTVRELLAGLHDYRLTTVRGRIHDIFDDDIDNDYVYLILDCEGETIYAPLNRRNHDDFIAKAAIGAEVSITGRCFAADTGWRRRIGRTFKAAGPDSVVLHSRPATDLFDAPLLEDCRRMRPSEVMALGRRRIVGTVIAVWHGNRVLLQTGRDIVSRVDLADDSMPMYGDCIEAVGFPGCDLYRINLSRAHWRHSTEKGMVQPQPSRLSIHDLCTDQRNRQRIAANLNFHGRAITVSGIVRSMPDSANPNKILYMEDGNLVLPVDFNSCPAAGKGLSAGCKAEISGTCIMDSENWRRNAVFPQINSVFLVMRTPDDVHILSRPPWWTKGRLLVVIAAMLAVILAVLLWNRSLRTLAEARGRELTAETVSRVTSDLKVCERTRLAVELHDSLAQYLTGAIMEIRAAVRLGGKIAVDMRDHLALALKTLDTCRFELRNCLWDLRSRALELPDMEKAILSTLAPHTSTITTAVRFHVPRERLSDNTAHAILRIVRELAINAVRHGHATELKVAGCLDSDKLLFSVQDNGCGFDPQSAPSVERGHFGLSGIHERVAAFGGEVSIESASGRGTRVTVVLRIPHPNDVESKMT